MHSACTFAPYTHTVLYSKDYSQWLLTDSVNKHIQLWVLDLMNNMFFLMFDLCIEKVFLFLVYTTLARQESYFEFTTVRSGCVQAHDQVPHHLHGVPPLTFWRYCGRMTFLIAPLVSYVLMGIESIGVHRAPSHCTGAINLMGPHRILQSIMAMWPAGAATSK